MVKEANALTGAGYDVTVLRPVLSAELAALDAEIVRGAGWTLQATTDLTAGRLGPLAVRSLRRGATEAVRRGAELPDALGYGVRQTLRQARALDADLTIGHQEVGLWVVNRLADSGHRVGVDLEDWYSEDLLPEARQGRPLGLLRREEAAAIRRGGHVTTTSEALAEALARTYGGPLPTVIYNAFPLSDRTALDGTRHDRVVGDPSRLSLHWVSQTVGAGRGLEEVVDALALVESPVEIHLRGTCAPDVEVALRARISERHDLFVHGLVPPGELLARIAEHDVGLALEAREPPSRDLTVTNKILHYLLAGLPAVASDTAGQREVARKAPGAVRVFPIGDLGALAEKISALAASPGALATAADAARAAAAREFSWEVQREAMLASVERALKAPAGAAAGGISKGS